MKQLDRKRRSLGQSCSIFIDIVLLIISAISIFYVYFFTQSIYTTMLYSLLNYPCSILSPLHNATQLKNNQN
uniref:Uncharacterized protein n=1 Tax=Lepeophtheirus salmonis TaxID=72036 RepID=A0A0K2T1R3_LEPSM